MTSEAMRVKIAEKMGWKSNSASSSYWMRPRHIKSPLSRPYDSFDDLPHYDTDLNALFAVMKEKMVCFRIDFNGCDYSVELLEGGSSKVPEQGVGDDLAPTLCCALCKLWGIYKDSPQSVMEREGDRL